ncbi:hypothetical protein, partial [Parasutterella sp.]|uniref:hypothetical protein n=1 Tax=Parasutterella sp. TaxID=2049037 RepID=UPI003080E886
AKLEGLKVNTELFRGSLGLQAISNKRRRFELCPAKLRTAVDLPAILNHLFNQIRSLSIHFQLSQKAVNSQSPCRTLCAFERS